MEVIGEGSVVQRDMSKPRSRCRKWELSVLVRDNNKKKHKTRTINDVTYSQAKDELELFKDELRGTPVTSDMLFADWFDIWMDRRRKSKAYAQRTLVTDTNKLIPAVDMLGDKNVGSITSDDIRTLYASVSEGDTPSGKPWSAGSVSRLRTSLSKMFADAIEEGIAASSPVTGVPIPKQDSEVLGKAMPLEKMNEVLSMLDYEVPPERAVALALGCGLRRSECCAVEDTDIVNSSVVVSSSCDEEGNLKPTKNGLSRTVPMPPPVADGFSSVVIDGRICDMLPHSLSRWWSRNRKRFGCEEYRFHDLRHSYATRLAASGVHMRVAMELCGWKSIAMAAKVYTHVSDDMQRDAVLKAFS